MLFEELWHFFKRCLVRAVHSGFVTNGLPLLVVRLQVAGQFGKYLNTVNVRLPTRCPSSKIQC